MKWIYLSVLEPEVAMIGGDAAPLAFGSPESENRKVEIFFFFFGLFIT